MTAKPRDSRFDSTLALLREGYRFILNRRLRLGVDVFEVRVLLLGRLICMGGEEAARLFYDESKFVRAGAMPRRAQKTLVGVGGVQGLDAAAHRERKALFMALMAPDRLRNLLVLTAQEWGRALARWQQQPRVELAGEVRQILCRAVCRWSGVPLEEHEVLRRTEDLYRLIDSPAAAGLRHWRGRAARRRAEAWIARLVMDLRGHLLDADPGTALREFACHRDAAGRLLPPRIAAVEILNVLRPTVAIGHYINFAALALHQYPEAARRVRAGDAGDLERFVQEVRRYYPFFPAVAARVRDDFEWRGFIFRRGRRVLLDLYGTCHDPRLWREPERFDPERFRDFRGDPFTFIPQGGGEHRRHHRCAGEWLTIELTKLAVAYLARGMRYQVPRQDLRYSPRHVPTGPRSGLIVTQVRRLPEAAAAARLVQGGSPRLGKRRRRAIRLQFPARDARRNTIAEKGRSP